jgi:hypothetical protein
MKFIRAKNIRSTPVTVIQTASAAGTTAATNIAIPGITINDRLAGVFLLNRDATAANINIGSVLSEASITSDGNIQLSTTNSTGDALMVIWQTGTV